jgi:hypothetical protein
MKMYVPILLLYEFFFFISPQISNFVFMESSNLFQKWR